MMLKNFIFILCCFYLLGCSSENINFSSSKNIQSKVTLPKPFVVDQKLQLKQGFIELTQPDNILQLDWSLLFKLNHTLTKSEINSSSLTVHTDCLLNPRKKFTIRTKRKLQRLVPIISILPKEILLLKSRESIICHFNFNAENPYRASHRFTLNSISIPKNISDTLDIKIIRRPKAQNVSDNKNLPEQNSVIFNSIRDYFISSHAYLKTSNNKYLAIESFGLHCDYFDRYTQNVSPKDTVALSLFFKTKDRPYNNNHPIQSCRILAYHQNLVVAMSNFFDLVFPHSPQISSYSAWDSFNQTYLTSYQKQISKERWKYDYIIKNPHPVPIFLKIKFLSYPPKAEIIELFHHLNQSKFRYFQTPIFVSAEIYENGVFMYNYSISELTNTILLEIQPSQYAFIRVAIHQAIEFCDPYKHPIKNVYWLGAILNSNQISIKQVLSDKRSSEILYTAPKTISNKTIFMFTPPLISFVKKNSFSALRFESFSCFNNSIIPKSPSKWLHLVNYSNENLRFYISPLLSAIDSQRYTLRWVWELPHLQNTLLPDPYPYRAPPERFFTQRNRDYIEP